MAGRFVRVPCDWTSTPKRGAIGSMAWSWSFQQSSTVGPMSRVRVGLPPYEEMEQVVLKRMLNPEYEFPPLLRAQLLTKLGLPQDYGKDIFTNAPTAIGLTNSLSITNGVSTNAARK